MRIKNFVVLFALWSVLPLYAANLYSEGTFHSLIEDRKATRIGDIVTIKIYERSNAQNSADTTTKNKSTNNAKMQADIHRIGSGQARTQISVGNNFEGGGSTRRSNRLLVTLSATIVDYAANGDYLIDGRQFLNVNNEQLEVSVSGRVRPEDIRADNSILSSHIADASINYSGSGDIAAKNNRPWWRIITDLLGL